MVLGPLSDQSANGYWRREDLKVVSRALPSGGNGEGFHVGGRLRDIPAHIVGGLPSVRATGRINDGVIRDGCLREIDVAGGQERAAARAGENSQVGSGAVGQGESR